MISIAMATYNGEKYINEQIDSILNQSYKDFELIIVDDCSNDNTLNLLYSYQNKSDKIKVYKNDENLGYLKNFEKALSYCKGDFIALADQDDIWSENHLQLLLDNIGNHYLISANSELVDSEGNSLNDFAKPLDYALPDLECNQLYTQFIRNTNQGCTCLFRKELLEHYSPYPQYVISHDYWLGCLALLQPENNGIKGLTYISNPIVKYRQHNKNSIGADPFSLKRIFNHFNKSSLDYYKRHDLFISNLNYSYTIDQYKLILDDIKKYIHNMSKPYTRIKGIGFYLKNSKYIYAKSHKCFYTFMYFIKLFVFFK